MEIKASPVHYITGVVFIALIIVTLFFTLKSKEEQQFLETSTIEKTRLTTAYVVKQESVIQKDLNKVLIPVIAEGTKTKKGGIIAIYKGEEYNNYKDTLSKMDKEIFDLMQDLPTIYSSEVDAIDRTIYMILKGSIGETSYAKMQEYKQRINSEINKRANIIGELSPAGAEIKELIEKRNKYEEETKKSNDNILSPIAGIVSYKTDGLENLLSVKNIDKLNYDQIKEKVANSNLIDNTSIKVVNNYEAYVVTKLPLEDKAYLKKNYDYTLRLVENNNIEISGELEKIVENEDEIEIYFKITNGIEELIDSRQIEIEIVWWQSTGLIVKNEALVKYENKDVYYVNVVKYSELVSIPVKIKKQNEKNSIITNYESEELEEMGIETDYKIKLHDRVIIKNKK